MSRQWSNSVVADTAIVTTAETAAITSHAVSQAVDGEPITIIGSVSVLTGTATTALTVRVREGAGVAGSVVGETLPLTIGAAADAQIPFQFTQAPAAVAGQQYTATVQATAATGNGTIRSAGISVAVGQP